jgi:hypothetical protein
VAKNDTVAVLGLTYKPDTYITEEAAGLLPGADSSSATAIGWWCTTTAPRPDNAPSLHEFDHLADPAALQQRDGHQAGGDLLSVAAVSLGEVRAHQGPYALEAVGALDQLNGLNG